MNLTDLLHLPVITGVFYALPFLVALTIIVFIHELGHFLVARWCGVDVEAFSIGFGREIFGWNDRHGTRWKVAWIPLGGYVRFRGDANAASMPDAEALERAKQEPGNFHGKPVWQRAAGGGRGSDRQFHPRHRHLRRRLHARRQARSSNRGSTRCWRAVRPNRPASASRRHDRVDRRRHDRRFQRPAAGGHDAGGRAAAGGRSTGMARKST